MQAMILAAGMGKRLGKYTRSCTKCMVRVGNVRLIDRMVAALKQAGIHKLIMVVGYIMKGWLFLVIAIVGEVIATSALKSSEGFTKLAPSAVVIIGYGIAFYFLSLVLKSIPVGVAYAVWSGLGVVIITAIAWLLHGQKLDAWGFVGMGLIIAAFLLARSPSWKSLRRPTPW